jgi:putative redox protein
MIKIRHINDHIYEAANGKDIIIIDPKKYTPVDMFVTGLANCSAYDVVELSKNKGYELENFILEVEYKRKDTYPKIFTEFHFIYSFNSKADNMTARRWVLSSLETYCSTINTVRNTSKIYYTIKHNGETIAFKENILSGNTHNQNEEFEEDDAFGCVA